MTTINDDNWDNSTDCSYSYEELQTIKKTDNGYNKICRKVNDKKEIIPIYTSGGTGKPIRNALTGGYFYNQVENKYYNPELSWDNRYNKSIHTVGSVYEDLYFKVVLATGECNNSSSTLFYLSPNHYLYHISNNTILSEDTILKWKEKKYAREKELKLKDKHFNINCSKYIDCCHLMSYYI